MHKKKKSYFTSIILTFVMCQLLVFFISLRFIAHPGLPFSLVYVLFLSTITFLIYKTGEVSKYRSIYFITFAILFTISFISQLYESGRTMILKDKEIQDLKVPMCHIVIFMSILPSVLKKTLIFPTPLVAQPPYGFIPCYSYGWLLL
jgi:hypothetical protein